MKSIRHKPSKTSEYIQKDVFGFKASLKLACLSAVLVAGESPSVAEDLIQALDAAYKRSEVIATAVAEHEADLERITISRAEGLPQVNASVAVNEFLAGPQVDPNLVTVQGGVSLPLYRGGSIRNRVNAARSQSEASFVGVRTAEAQVFSAVVSAYATVIRDRQILALSRDNLDKLTTTLNATRARFQARDLTRTDVSQAEARVALAQGEVETAEANLVEAMEEYRRLTGSEPDYLEALPPLRNLPANAEMAVAAARDENPQLLAARARVEARRYEWQAAKGNARPTVSATANGRFGNEGGQLPSQRGGDSRFGATVGLSLNVPLFQGGRATAGIREANIRESQAILAVRDLEGQLVARARSEYANWRATSSVVVASEKAVEAARSALAGVRAESDVGTRTILDILNAEQELRNAQVQLVSAQRDSYVAGFSLLTTMGQTQAHHLGLGGKTDMPIDTGSGAGTQTAFESFEEAFAEDIASASAIPAPPPPPPPVIAPPPIAVAKPQPKPVPKPAPAPAPVPATQPARASASAPFDADDWVIQLAAFSEQATARSHWNTVQADTVRITGRTTPVIAAISTGEREMFRLAIGPFPDFAAAEAACHDLRLQNRTCIVRRFPTLGRLQWTGPQASEGKR